MIQSNIWKYYLHTSLANVVFFIPIIAIFMKDLGLSLTQFYLLQTIYSFSIVIFEIPTGYFADIKGRKNSLIVGSVFLTIAIIVYSISYSFLQFVFAEILWGIGFAFLSGSGSALVFDTLLNLGKGTDYKKIEGKAFFFGRIISIFATIIGSYMAIVFLRLPFIAMIPFFIIMIFVAISFEEPPLQKRIYEANYLKQFNEILKESMRNRETRWLILYSGLVNGFGILVFWGLQPLMDKLSIPIGYYGWYFAVLALITAIVAKYAFALEKLIGRKKSLSILGFMIGIPSLLIGLFPSTWILSLMLFVEIAWAFQLPIIKDYLNIVVNSKKRATILSISSFLGWLIVGVYSPIFGFIADNLSIEISFIISGIVCIIGSIILVYFFKKDNYI